jgi:hypothetical protein
MELRHDTSRRTRLALAASAICLVSVAAGCRGEDTSSPPLIPPDSTTRTQRSDATGRATPPGSTVFTAPHVAKPYALHATLRCLKRRPDVTTTTQTKNPRLRAMRDLAQRTSVVVRSRQQDVGLAVLPSEGDARLLAELLRAPDDPYRIVLRRNAVLFFLRSARASFATTADCLRTAARQA